MSDPDEMDFSEGIYCNLVCRKRKESLLLFSVQLKMAR